MNRGRVDMATPYLRDIPRFIGVHSVRFVATDRPSARAIRLKRRAPWLSDNSWNLQPHFDADRVGGLAPSLWHIAREAAPNRRGAGQNAVASGGYIIYFCTRSRLAVAVACEFLRHQFSPLTKLANCR
jgi:hypothetical protein